VQVPNPIPKALDLVKLWWAEARWDFALVSHVHVSVTPGGTRDSSRVSIDHRIPSHESSGRVGWRITTRKQFLPRAHFDADVRARVNSASIERGRRLFCIDVEQGEVVAAIAYHVDDKPHLPLLLTAIALRTDADASADLFGRSRGAAYILKQYAHEIARQLERGDFVDIDAQPAAEADLRDLGFRKAPRVRGMRVSGTHWRQNPATS